jgi:hypothetical protein
LVGALDALESFDAMTLQRAIFENTKRVLGVKTHGVVYDVTNTYFHGKRCQLARFGHDKENRKGYPLIQIGLAVTAEHGIPIFHKTFPGNIHDSRTFMDVSTDLMHLGIRGGVALLKMKVAPLGISFQEALHELDGLYRVYLHDPKSGFKLGRLITLTKRQEQILRAVDKRLLKKCKM